MTDSVSPSTAELFDRQAELQNEAAAVLSDLDVFSLLDTAGVPHRVGSLAHGLMVWRDIDVTVVCQRLTIGPVTQIASHLADHSRVPRRPVPQRHRALERRPVCIPDGLFLGVEYVADHRWELDIWFVDDPERQPDLGHVTWLADRLTDRHRAVILAIKHAWHERPEYGTSVSSHDIYTAVIDSGIESPAEFAEMIRQRRSR